MKTILSMTHKGFTIIRTRDRNLVKGFTLIKTPLRMNFVKANRGFTLIELLIVISIIGVLVTFVMLNVGNAQRKARDAERKSDLKQYQAALTSFAGNNSGFYPSYNSTWINASDNLCTKMVLTKCPDDPLSSQNYKYTTNPSGTGRGDANATQYILVATIEVPQTAANTVWYICSNGQTGEAENRGSVVCN